MIHNFIFNESFIFVQKCEHLVQSYNNVSFRLAEDCHLDRILEIWTQGWCQTHPQDTIESSQIKQFKKNFLNRSHPFNFWLVETEEDIAGWVSVVPAFYHPMKDQSEAEISIYIDKVYSNNGLGTQVTSHVLEEINETGINNVWAFVSKHNEASKAMCMNAGMSICGQTSSRFVLIKEYN